MSMHVLFMCARVRVRVRITIIRYSLQYYVMSDMISMHNYARYIGVAELFVPVKGRLLILTSVSSIVICSTIYST